MSELTTFPSRREPISMDCEFLGAGLRIEARSGGSIALLTARKNQGAEFNRHARETFGVDLPAIQYSATTESLTVLCLAPSRYLVFRDAASPSWSWSLASSFSDCATVVDQSGAFAVLRLIGPRARRLLQAGVFLDFHPAAFPVGRVAATLFSHFNVIVWRLEGDAAFELAVPRSFAGDFYRVLREQAFSNDGDPST